MGILGSLFGRGDRGASAVRVRGDEFLSQVYEEAYSSLDAGEIEDVYRAAISASTVVSTGLLANDPLLAELWGEGNLVKARAIIGVWTSIIAHILLQNEANQDAVVEGIGKATASLFGTEAGATLRELRACSIQHVADQETRKSGGVPSYEYSLIYLRCLKALGKQVPDFGDIPVPIPSMAEVFAKFPGISGADLGFESVMLMPAMIGSGARTAREIFDSLRA